MNVSVFDGNNISLIEPKINRVEEIPLIKPKDIKAILYLGLRGEISLPVEEHSVDILA